MTRKLDTSPPDWLKNSCARPHLQEDHDGDAHPLAAFILRPESPFLMFFADLGDHDWRAAERAYRTGDFGMMTQRLGSMSKRRRIAYMLKEGAEAKEKQ